MNARQSDGLALLRELAALTPAQRARYVRAQAAPETIFEALADAIENLAMTQINEATQAATLVVELADDVECPRGRVLARRGLAQSLSYAGRFEDALAACATAQAIAEAGGLRLDAARVRLAAMHALVHLARYDDAAAAGLAARQTFLECGAATLVGRAETSLGGVYQKRGDCSAALAWFERARPRLHDDPVALAQMESNRGLALLSLDEFAAAESAYCAARAAFERAGLSWAVAIVDGNLAELCTQQGRLQDALRQFERVRAYLEREAAPAELARVLTEQAEALLALRAVDIALRQFRIALSALERHGLVREALQARAGIGRSLLLRGAHEEAEAWLVQAADGYRTLGPSSALAAVTLARAQLALDTGRPEAARTLAEEALHLAAGRPHQEAAARYHLAQATLALGRVRETLEILSPAVAVARQLEIPTLLADLLDLRGRAHFDLGDTPRARADLRAAVAAIERVRGALQAERLRASFHTDRLATYGRLVHAALAAPDESGVNEAFAAVERARSRALLDQVAGRVESSSPPLAEDGDSRNAEFAALRDELNALYSRIADAHHAGNPENVAIWQHKVRSRERRLALLEQRLASARGIASLYAETVDAEAVRARLPADTAVVEYYGLGDELLTFVLRPDDLSVQRQSVRARDLEDGSDRLGFQIRRALRPGSITGPRGERMHRDARHTLAALYDLLLRPVADRLRDARQLVFVPHGPLHALPLHALWDGERYVIERWVVRYAPSASLLTRLRPRPFSLAAGTFVAGVADDRAPQIEHEVRTVAAALGCRHVCAQSAATVDAVRHGLQRAAVAHIACHGHFSTDNPHGSGLRLADRWLTVADIYALRLNAALVTLSGCETGRTSVGAGDDLVGLVRAFLAAGAGRLLVSLWAAQDGSSAELMRALYNELGSASPGPASDVEVADAWRTAQLGVMHTRRHPALWAPFVLVGGVR